MALRLRISFLLCSLLLWSFFSGCSSEEELIYLMRPVINDSSIEFNAHNDSLGRINAVKKARQLTDIPFMPSATFKGLGKTYSEGSTFQGMVYSMVSETSNYVGDHISFHTFMTALHNPKSRLYTDDVSQPPYHGKNCNAYYGTVCSHLVSYALGIFPGFSSRCFNESDLMTPIDPQEIDSIKVADILWKNGHVALITGVNKDGNQNVTDIEISESVSGGCRRYWKTRAEFEDLMSSSFKKIFRYSELYKNQNYTSIPEFVAVLDEEPQAFQYNEDLCADRGDKSCYLESDTVVVNVMHTYDRMEIFKDGDLYREISQSGEDVRLFGLPYGDYKARLLCDGQYSDYTYWKVVNVNVRPDKANGKLYFHSENARPMYVTFRDIAGLMQPIPTNRYCFYIFDDKDIQNGFVDVDKINIRPEYPYVRIHFKTEYGSIINHPIDWNE